MFVFNGRTIVSLALAGAALAAPTNTRTMSRRAEPSKNVVIQLFEWNWNSIAQECKDFIGPAGYGFVQVSPATEHIQGGQWWTSYQQVSFNLQSKRGSRDEFSAMVNACKGAGVGVLVDSIWNHMAGVDGGTGVAGTGFSHYGYPNFSGNDFHHCGTPGDDIDDWNNLWKVQNCELSNLADLNTGDGGVRSKIAAHANDLLNIGVAGFRLDAAKHVPVEDLEAIFSLLNKPKDQLVITSEVIGNSPIRPEAYNGIGDVIVSDYYEALKAAFTSSGIAGLQDLKNRYSVQSSGASVHVATHDSERGRSSLGQLESGSTFESGAYALAHTFMLTYPYGSTPTVLSSYAIDNGDVGAPNNGYGTCNGQGGANGFICQHRWASAARVVPLHNAIAGEDLNNWQSSGGQRVAYGRGRAAFVLLNNEDGEWSADVGSQLADGTYCDLISGGKNGGSCAGISVSVSGGRVRAQVPGRKAVVLWSDAKL